MGGGPPDLPPPAAPPNISLEGDSRLMDWDLLPDLLRGLEADLFIS